MNRDHRRGIHMLFMILLTVVPYHSLGQDVSNIETFLRHREKEVFQVEEIPRKKNTRAKWLAIFGDRLSSQATPITLALFEEIGGIPPYKETVIRRFFCGGGLDIFKFQIGNFSGKLHDEVLIEHQYLSAGNRGGVAIDSVHLFALSAPYPELLQLDTRYFDWNDGQEDEFTTTFEFHAPTQNGRYGMVTTHQMFTITTDDGAYYKYGIPGTPVYTLTSGKYLRFTPITRLFAVDYNPYYYTVKEGEKVLIQYQCPYIENIENLDIGDEGASQDALYRFYCETGNEPEIQRIVLVNDGIPLQIAPETFSEDTQLLGFTMLPAYEQKKQIGFQAYHDTEHLYYVWDIITNQVYFQGIDTRTGKTIISDNLRENSQEVKEIKAFIEAENDVKSP